jgi:hypothetical protein
MFKTLLSHTTRMLTHELYTIIGVSMALGGVVGYIIKALN